MKAPFRSARSAVIAAMLQHKQMSRTELSEVTEVSPAAITEITQDLLQAGVFIEMAGTTPIRGRGRPTTLLSLHASHAYFVGLSVSEVTMPMVLTDLQGRIAASHPMPLCQTPQELVSVVRKTFPLLLRNSGVTKSRVLGVGITMNGITDPETGICRYCAAFNWRDVPIAEMIGKALHLPARVDNDANAVAVAAKLFGPARDYKDFCSIILGRTIGAAHYVHGMLYRGHDGGAGEIGHITIDPKGILCRCGRNGCLDTFAGAAALQRSAQQHGLQAKTMRELEALAVQGNTHATRLLRKAGAALGATVASLVHISNPQCVLFTDMEGFENGVFRTATRQAIENNILPRFLGSTAIVFCDAEPGSLPRSAASIAARAYLASL